MPDGSVLLGSERFGPAPDAASLSGGRHDVAAGRAACQRATRVLRDATALRVTRRPSRHSDCSYGPCGPAWTGASRPTTTTHRTTATARTRDGASDRNRGLAVTVGVGRAGRSRPKPPRARALRQRVTVEKRALPPRFGPRKAAPHAAHWHHRCRSRSTTSGTGKNGCRQAAKVVDAEQARPRRGRPASTSATRAAPRPSPARSMRSRSSSQSEPRVLRYGMRSRPARHSTSSSVSVTTSHARRP